jgi:hypothetical protein
MIISLWPDLFRPSTSLRRSLEDVDGRDARGHDGYPSRRSYSNTAFSST